MVERLRGAGYTIRAACGALGISRSGYYASKRPRQPRKAGGTVRAAEDAVLLEKIEALKTKHPFWGYRRVRAWLLYRENVLVNEKRVRRIMKEHGLMAPQTVRKVKAERKPGRSKPKANKPKQFWGIDATKFIVNALGWVYLVIVLDWYTKKIVGWKLSVRNRAVEWKDAVDMAVNGEFPEGVRGKGLKLISDNGSQPTSISFMKDTSTMEIEQIFTSYNNPKGNADTERMMRTIKEEVIWLNEFETFEEAKKAIEKWLAVDYNKLYVHSALGYRSPEEFETLYYQEGYKKAI